DLPLEQLAWLGFKLNAALVGPEILGFPQAPVAVVELLHEPGKPAGSGLRHDHLQLRMPFKDAPGEKIDKRLEEIAHKELRVLEDARRLAHDTAAGFADKDRDVPGEDDARVLQRLPERLPSLIVELGIDIGDLEIDLPHPALRGEAAQLGHGRGR